MLIKITDVAENKILLEASIEDILFLLNDKMEMYSRSSKHFLMDYHIQISSEKCRHEEKQNGNQYNLKVLNRMTSKTRKMLFLRGELVQTGAPFIGTYGNILSNFQKMFSSF